MKTKAVIPLLVIAVVTSAVGWQFQERAAATLANSRRINLAAVPESDSAPPTTEHNQQIVDSLKRSTEIRRMIDGLLTDVSASVRRLGASQEVAAALAARSRSLITHVGGSLGGSVDAADASLVNLERLALRVGESRRLAELIVQELAELDRRLGP